VFQLELTSYVLLDTLQNDACSNAIDLGTLTGGQSVTLTGQSNINAAYDSDVAVDCGVSTNNGVWYKLNAPFPAEVTASTCNQANFDTMISMYSGACGSLVCETGADDSGGCGLTTRLTDDVPFGSIYIMVHGFYGYEGNFDLTVSIDLCPDDDTKVDPGVCGCGAADVDANRNNQIDCTECGFGTYNRATQQCECSSVSPGGPGYCKDADGKCTTTKIIDAPTNSYYCPGSTPPSQTVCTSKEMCEALFLGGICLRKPATSTAYCAANNACVNGSYNSSTLGCSCRESSPTGPGFCVDGTTGACTVTKVLGSLTSAGWTYSCPTQRVRRG